ncbi:MAG TPA: hypothetical protein H9815_01325 [Candidatus Ruania gallistercoris]|uniref:Uncharacterized protein n=1 Tax=Candidatus Ruania gallistercoris TaxID=2838746 RepID=A0A9D2EBK1_9MICO|nr:hypothetical protein [Candidatus Ruania gallistercoris]
MTATEPLVAVWTTAGWGSGMAGPTVHLVLASTSGRESLTVPADSTVRELLGATGIDAGRVGVATLAGEPLDLDSSIGADTPSGTLLWVHDRDFDPVQREAERRRRRRRVRTAPEDRPVLVAVAVGALAVAGMVATATGVAADNLAGALVLLATTAVLLVHPQARRSVPTLILAPVLGAAAGFLAIGMTTTGVRTPLVVALLAGGMVACIQHGFAARLRLPTRTLTPVVAVFFATAALLVAGAFLLEMAPLTPAALILAAVPLVLRALASWSLNVPEEDLLDIPYLIREAESVRAITPRAPRTVDWEEVMSTVRIARRRSDVGALLTCAAALATTPAVLGMSVPRTLAGWCAFGAVCAVTVFLGLYPRAVWRPMVKIATRVTAGLMLVFLAWYTLQVLQLGAVLLATGLLLLGVLCVALVVPLAKGWRSVAWSRAGDVLGGLCVVLVPTACLLASGLIDELGRMMSR